MRIHYAEEIRHRLTSASGSSVSASTSLSIGLYADWLAFAHCRRGGTADATLRCGRCCGGISGRGDEAFGVEGVCGLVQLYA